MKNVIFIILFSFGFTSNLIFDMKSYTDESELYNYIIKNCYEYGPEYILHLLHNWETVALTVELDNYDIIFKYLSTYIKFSLFEAIDSPIVINIKHRRLNLIINLFNAAFLKYKLSLL